MEQQIIATTYFTSESVSEGHPDKLADRIADAILDYCLKKDSKSRVACEVFLGKEFVLIGGEITCNPKNTKEEYISIARRVLRDVGYTDKKSGIDPDHCKILVKVKNQSANIKKAVDNKNELNVGAGDQGFVFGYATNETEEYMPLAIKIASKLVRKASKLRHDGFFLHARPDMKSQVVVDYANPNKPKIVKVLMSIQHEKMNGKEKREFLDYIKTNIIKEVLADNQLNTNPKISINPSKKFEIGGPLGDTGLTGRKLVVDTYGGACRHGGGALSGKDATKVDRSGSYMARYVAKNLVAAGVADRLELQIAYEIGDPNPYSISFSTFGTAKCSDEKISEIITTLFDLRPGAIIKNFSLDKPSFKYEDVSVYGHFGRPELNLPWEKLDKVDQIKNLLNK